MNKWRLKAEFHHPLPIIYPIQEETDESRTGFIKPSIFAVVYRHRTGVTIRNSRARGFDTGLYVLGGKNFLFENNDFSNNFLDDNSNIEHLKPIPHGGMILNGIQSSHVQGNTSSGNTTGIQIVNSSKIPVQQNVTSRNRGWGIYLYGTTASQVFRTPSSLTIGAVRNGARTLGAGPPASC